MEKTAKRKAFTVVELMVSLVVTSVLLSAVAALAYAMSSATTVGDDTTVKQTQLRHATLNILDLVRTCRMVCADPGADLNDLVLWRADDNNDGRINVDELVYIEGGNGLDKLQLCYFESGADEVLFESLAWSTTKDELIKVYGATYKTLIPICSDVTFTVDVVPPWTNELTVAFDLAQEDSLGHYEISAKLWAWAGHLLDDTGNLITTGDDDE